MPADVSSLPALSPSSDPQTSSAAGHPHSNHSHSHSSAPLAESQHHMLQQNQFANNIHNMPTDHQHHTHAYTFHTPSLEPLSLHANAAIPPLQVEPSALSSMHEAEAALKQQRTTQTIANNKPRRSSSTSSLVPLGAASHESSPALRPSRTRKATVKAQDSVSSDADLSHEEEPASNQTHNNQTNKVDTQSYKRSPGTPSRAARPARSGAGGNNSGAGNSSSRGTPKRGQGVSCHSCKTSKDTEALIFCTHKGGLANKKRRCRKKYCATCLKRSYIQCLPTPETNLSKWICPSCLYVCQCANCQRRDKSEGNVPQAVRLPLKKEGSKSGGVGASPARRKNSSSVKDESFASSADEDEDEEDEDEDEYMEDEDGDDDEDEYVEQPSPISDSSFSASHSGRKSVSHNTSGETCSNLHSPVSQSKKRKHVERSRSSSPAMYPDDIPQTDANAFVLYREQLNSVNVSPNPSDSARFNARQTPSTGTGTSLLRIPNTGSSTVTSRYSSPSSATSGVFGSIAGLTRHVSFVDPNQQAPHSTPISPFQRLSLSISNGNESPCNIAQATPTTRKMLSYSPVHGKGNGEGPQQPMFPNEEDVMQHVIRPQGGSQHQSPSHKISALHQQQQRMRLAMMQAQMAELQQQNKMQQQQQQQQQQQLMQPLRQPQSPQHQQHPQQSHLPQYRPNINSTNDQQLMNLKAAQQREWMRLQQQIQKKQQEIDMERYSRAQQFHQAALNANNANNAAASGGHHHRVHSGLTASELREDEEASSRHRKAIKRESASCHVSPMNPSLPTNLRPMPSHVNIGAAVDFDMFVGNRRYSESMMTFPHLQTPNTSNTLAFVEEHSIMTTPTTTSNHQLFEFDSSSSNSSAAAASYSNMAPQAGYNASSSSGHAYVNSNNNNNNNFVNNSNHNDNNPTGSPLDVPTRLRSWSEPAFNIPDELLHFRANPGANNTSVVVAASVNNPGVNTQQYNASAPHLLKSEQAAIQELARQYSNSSASSRKSNGNSGVNMPPPVSSNTNTLAPMNNVMGNNNNNNMVNNHGVVLPGNNQMSAARSVSCGVSLYPQNSSQAHNNNNNQQGMNINIHQVNNAPPHFNPGQFLSPTNSLTSPIGAPVFPLSPDPIGASNNMQSVSHLTQIPSNLGNKNGDITLNSFESTNFDSNSILATLGAVASGRPQSNNLTASNHYSTVNHMDVNNPNNFLGNGMSQPPAQSHLQVPFPSSSLNVPYSQLSERMPYSMMSPAESPNPAMHVNDSSDHMLMPEMMEFP